MKNIFLGLIAFILTCWFFFMGFILYRVQREAELHYQLRIECLKTKSVEECGKI